MIVFESDDFVENGFICNSYGLHDYDNEGLFIKNTLFIYLNVNNSCESSNLVMPFY